MATTKTKKPSFLLLPPVKPKKPLKRTLPFDYFLEEERKVHKYDAKDYEIELFMWQLYELNGNSFEKMMESFRIEVSEDYDRYCNYSTTIIELSGKAELTEDILKAAEKKFIEHVDKEKELYEKGMEIYKQDLAKYKEDLEVYNEHMKVQIGKNMAKLEKEMAKLNK
jgi:hypothetical protein